MRSLTAGVVGGVIGFSVAEVIYKRWIGGQIHSFFTIMSSDQYYRCALSLNVLNKLEAQQMDRAKLLLAREIAKYYRNPPSNAKSSEREKMLSLIESASTNSETLKQELAKAPAGSPH
jgi:hypothetical protein